MKKNLVTLLILVSILISCSTGAPSDPPPVKKKELKIASFNINNFGKTKADRPNVLKMLGQTISKFDIIAIQELSDMYGNSFEQLFYSTQSSSESNEYWNCMKFESGDEQYGFIWRKDLVSLEFNSISKDTVFARPPAITYFRTIDNELDFSVISVHIKPDNVKAEMIALENEVANTSLRYSDRDVICLGDFNADGDFYDEGGSLSLNGWDGYVTVITNDIDTTVSKNNDYTYDRIQMTEDMVKYFKDDGQAFIFADHFSASDIFDLEGTISTYGTEYALSDHYPIWMTLEY